MVKEEDVLNFAASSITSIWALELLLLVRQDRRAWTGEERMRQLQMAQSWGALAEQAETIRDLFRHVKPAGHA